MKILLRLFFLMLFTFFSEAGKAQRTIEDSDPDYDKSYAMHNLMYGGFKQLGLGDYAHFSNFFSEHAKANKIKEIRRRVYRKDSLSKEYKLESIQITKFIKGFLSEELEIEYLKNRFTGKAVSVPDTIKWIVYTRKGYAISVLIKIDDYHPVIKTFSSEEVRPIEIYYFRKSRNLDSVLVSYNNKNLKQFYEYDRMGRLIASNKFSIEYSIYSAINPIDSTSFDSLKNLPLFIFFKTDLSGLPDTSFLMRIKPKGNFQDGMDSAYYTRIINLKGPYIYWYYQIIESHRSSNFLRLYQLKGNSVILNSIINMYHHNMDNQLIVQYLDYRQKGEKGIRTNYHTNYYFADKVGVQEVDIETGNFEADNYRVVYEVVK